MQPKHRRQIPSWVTPARQQCLTFPLVYSCTAETVPGAVRHGRGYGVSRPYILYRSAPGTVYWTVRHSKVWGTYTFWACANNACQSRDERSRVTVERPMAVSWSNDEVLRLIHAWGDSTIQAQLEGCKWNQDVHDKIASELLIHLRLRPTPLYLHILCHQSFLPRFQSANTLLVHPLNTSDNLPVVASIQPYCSQPVPADPEVHHRPVFTPRNWSHISKHTYTLFTRNLSTNICSAFTTLQSLNYLTNQV